MSENIFPTRGNWQNRWWDFESPERRAKFAKEIAQSKCKIMLHICPRREMEIVRRLQEKNQGPMNKEGVEAVFREIISACRALEHQLVISYLGPEGTYTTKLPWKNSVLRHNCSCEKFYKNIPTGWTWRKWLWCCCNWEFHRRHSEFNHGYASGIEPPYLRWNVSEYLS